MTLPNRSARGMLLVVAIATGLVATGCKKKDAEKSDPGKQEAAMKAPAERPASAMGGPARPAAKTEAPRKAPPPRLKPLPWPPAKIEAPKLRATCKSLCGTKSKGDFFNKCRCKGKGLESPLAARKTDKYHKFFKAYEFEVVNRSNRGVTWASVNIYYYDAYGKQLTVVIKDADGKRPDRKYERYQMNGSTLSVPANTTKKITMGWSKTKEPKGTARVEVVFDGWCYGKRDRKTHKEKNRLCMWIEHPPKQRPMTK